MTKDRFIGAILLGTAAVLLAQGIGVSWDYQVGIWFATFCGSFLLTYSGD
jgi:hypothetical protein